MTKTTLCLILSLLTAFCTYAQTTPVVELPAFNDEYSALVKQLEAGQTDIDYRAFREKFIESEQFKIASKRSKEYDSLKKEMYTQMGKRNAPEVIKITKQMLSINYTSMIAHKILRQTYSIIGDTSNAARYKAIQFGLLNSIVNNGDGNTCTTAWPVVQIEEEYFILQMLGADVLKQSTDTKGGHCDKMEVKTEEGEKKTYYFGISKIFEGYKKLMSK
ncbi:DUF4919 domain-containing protein [Paraflavitalea soli]|nr:DUF4919 domain-containing protein [Paraflavitalea soli]